MRHQICAWIIGSALFWTSTASVAKPVPDEFIAPLQAGAVSSTPRKPAPIRTIKDELTQQPTVRARTAQAAIAAVVGQRAAGCWMIRFGMGLGWVVTGTASYRDSENPVALRRSRQDARLKAFTDASVRLAGCLAELPPEARQRITEVLEQNDAIRLALINLAFTDADTREQALKILARGFVTYLADDDPQQRTVSVSLVTTPKTAVRLTRPAPNAVEAVSLQEGLRQVQAEIKAGLIPPVGNRLIAVNATGELALVGYAVNLIGAHPDPAAQDKLRIDAEKIATGRATEALMGLATGDDTAWQNGLDEASRNDILAFNGGYADGEPSVTRFAQVRDLIMTAIKDDAGVIALRENRLPSAVTVKRFSGEDTITVLVSYIPPVKKRESKPVPPPATHAGTPAANPLPSVTTQPAASAGGALPSVPPAPPTGENVPPAASTVEPQPAPPASPAEPAGDGGTAGGSKPAEAR